MQIHLEDNLLVVDIVVVRRNLPVVDTLVQVVVVVDYIAPLVDLAAVVHSLPVVAVRNRLEVVVDRSLLVVVDRIPLPVVVRS